MDDPLKGRGIASVLGTFITKLEKALEKEMIALEIMLHWPQERGGLDQ